MAVYGRSEISFPITQGTLPTNFVDQFQTQSTELGKCALDGGVRQEVLVLRRRTN